MRRGLASASVETKLKAASTGGMAPHQKRSPAAARPESRVRVAKAGGKARTPNSKGLVNASRMGGKGVKEKYDLGFYREIG